MMVFGDHGIAELSPCLAVPAGDADQVGVRPAAELRTLWVSSQGRALLWPGLFVDDTTRVRLQSVRDGLKGLLALLERPVSGVPFELMAATGTTERPVRPARRGKR